MEPEKKKRGRKKKEKLVEQEVINTPKENFNPTGYGTNTVYSKHGFKTLDEITGDKYNPYEQTTEEEYENYLNDLNQSDLEKHASSHLVLPRPDRHAMTKLLLREFRIKTSEYFGASVIQPIKMKPVSQEVLKILSEGR